MRVLKRYFEEYDFFAPNMHSNVGKRERERERVRKDARYDSLAGVDLLLLPNNRIQNCEILSFSSTKQRAIGLLASFKLYFWR